MVLHPLDTQTGAEQGSKFRAPIPAWKAVETKQKQPAKDWLLITQVDHADLAGALAARLQSPLIPPLQADIVRAIAVHDAGWAAFDAAGGGSPDLFHPKLKDDGTPLSFLDVCPADFLVAWKASIREGQQACPAGGFMVSRHFCRLAEGRLSSRIDNEEDTSRLRRFLHEEAERQNRLTAVAGYSRAELEALTDVLQFCDLLSLYLCCGATEAVEFPQSIRNIHVKVRREADMFQCDPAVFGSGVSLGISGRLYGGMGKSECRSLAFLIQ